MKKALPFIIVFFVVLTLVITWIALGDQIKAYFTKTTTPAPLAPGAPAPSSGSSGQLNEQLLLKKGIYNSSEVAELQKRLGGLDADGDFGDKTLARLVAVKCVSEIKLADYDSTTCPVNGAGADNQDAPWYESLPFAYAFFN